jgi:glycosyltransferase involved in cell wall biosynthesis
VKRLRIAHLLATPDGKLGGLEKHTLDLCAELSKTHDMHLLADPGFAQQCPPGVSFHAVNFRRSRWNPRLYLEIYRHLGSIKPDVLHAQAGKSATIWRNLKRLFPETAAVATQHGVQKNIRPYLAMDKIITVSATLADRYPPGRATVIHNGLRLPQVLSANQRQQLRTQLAGNWDGPLVIAVGRLDAIKGFDVLLRAMKDVPAKLLLVGDGSERTSLHALAAELGISAHVSFLGWRSDIAALLQAADICVISSHSEGFPLVMVEALHAGIPLLSTRVSGVKEILPAELLVPVNDAEGLHALLAAQLKRLPELRVQLSSRFAMARQDLTLAGMARRTEAVYFDALRSRTRTPGSTRG